MKKNLIIGGVIVLALGVLAFNALQPAPAPNGSPAAPAPQNQPTAQAPVAPAILGATFSKSISPIGESLSPATTFSPATPNIYAVLSLQGAKRTTQLAYVRKYNGKYVDSKVSHPPKDAAKNFYFLWKLNPGQTRKAGAYSITFYVNGARSLTVGYAVK